VVDATATLLAFHQTGSDGEKAGLKSKNGDVNIMRIGQFNYESGFTTSAQRETRFIVDEICNRTRVVVKSRRIKHRIIARVSIPPTNRARNVLAGSHTKRIILERPLGRFRAVTRIPITRRRRVIGRRTREF